MQDFIRRHPNLLALLALAALSLIAYANSLPNSFQFDDYEGIVKNPAVHDLKNIPFYFTNPTLFRFSKTDWRPVLQITYALDYAIGGLTPTVFHITNILFHVGTAWLIFLIVAEIDKKRPLLSPPTLFVPGVWLYLIPAAMFAVHTVNSQTVDYIWARSSLLAAFFYLVSFYCYLRGPLSSQDRSNLSWHLGGLAAFGLGLASKATAASLPAMLVAYEILFLNPAGRNPLILYLKEPRRLIKYLPLAALFLGYVALRFFMLPRSVQNFIAPPWVSRSTYLFTQFRAWVYYIKLYLWPDPLILDYPGFGWSASFWDVRVLSSFALIAAIIVAAWRVRRTEPILSFFMCWFFIALLPEASIVVRPDKVTGYRPYLAYAGLSVAAALLSFKAAMWFWHKWKREEWSEARFRLGYAVAFGLVLIALTGATIRRNLDWRDPVTLWSDALRKDSTNTIGYMTLSMAYTDREEYEKAQELIDRAVQLSPGNPHAYYYRGYLNMVLERNDEALSDLTKAITLQPSATNFLSRGHVYRKMGRYDEALTDYQTALGKNRRLSEAYFGIAMVHWERKELSQATEACRKLNEIDPGERQGYICLGSLLMHQSLFGEAFKVYYNGVTRFPQDSILWYGLGTAYEELGLYREAQDAYAKSSSLMRQAPIEEKRKRTYPEG
jgi:tetratricopeptide (TPR) repeat protein